MRALKAASKASDELVFQMSDGVIGQLDKSFRADAPTVQRVHEMKTVTQIEIAEFSSGLKFTKMKAVQDISAKAGACDIYRIERKSLGDLVESGGGRRSRPQLSYFVS